MTKNDHIKVITVKQLESSLRTGNTLLIDVREPEEYLAGYIKDAVLIPLAEISYDKLPSKYKNIIIYCRSGKRSWDACYKLMVEANAQDMSLDVASLDGGIIAWEAAGFDVLRMH